MTDKLVFGRDQICSACKGSGQVGPKDQRFVCGRCAGKGYRADNRYEFEPKVVIRSETGETIEVDVD
jgi:DnaJ-class molecular chaperone